MVKSHSLIRSFFSRRRRREEGRRSAGVVNEGKENNNNNSNKDSVNVVAVFKKQFRVDVLRP